MKSLKFALILLVLWSLSSSPKASADEGMWLFNELPLKQLREKYGFEPTDEWTNHVMKSCVRFNVGGSASFISSNGLVMTNHHVASDTLFKLSSKENNYAKDGFLAKTRADEIKAPDLELNQLINIKDVTDKVNAAVTDSMNPEEAAKARRAIIAEIEKEATQTSKLRSDVVTLYGGGKYHLYQYKKYTDVRLVWAPEAAAAFFGGDADNFEYPRFCLDATFFRVYEDGKPAKTPHFFKWSANGAKEGELTFVSGNPGSTSRIFTYDAMRFQRDHRVPYVLDFIRRREILLQQFGLEGEEQKRRAQDSLFGIQNARKAYLGEIQGLQNPGNMTRKKAAEAQMIAKVKSDPKLADYASAWEKIADVQEKRLAKQGKGISMRTRIFTIAHQLVQLEAEDNKPNSERLPAFRESGRASLEQQLFSKAPVYKDLEQVVLGDLIARTLELRGADDPLCVKLLDGKSPLDRAAELVQGTKVDDVAFRKQLAKDGASSSKDPMIQFAMMLDPQLRKDQEESDELAEIERQAYAQITKAQFAIQGTSAYPDATFTLRLAFGPVKSYRENGQSVPAWTNFAGAFQHEETHGAKGDYKLPKSWHDAKDKLDPATPYNFVNTADIIGGNSGSPVINKDLEVVGLIFDGNIQSLTADYFFSDEQGRAVSVHSSAIREALKHVYDANHLAEELGK